MLSTRSLAVAALFCASLAVVNAQPQTPRRPGATPGATPAPGGAGALPGPVDRLKNKVVAEELKISQDQLEKLKAWSEDFPTRLQAAVQAETYRQLGDVLTPEQVKRLKEIEIQAAGLRAFNMPDVSAALKLSDDQKARITTMREEAASTSRGAFAGFLGGGQRPSEEKLAEARKKAHQVIADGMNKAQALLTDDQRAAWKSLIGDPFDTSTLTTGTYGGGRPGLGNGTRPGTSSTPSPQPNE